MEEMVSWMDDNKYILELKNITKKFMGIIANDNISLKIRKGEIYAILGENGAGKSTLMNILIGLYTPTSGKIYVNSKEVHIKSPKDSIQLGIGMVHQHYKLVEILTVAENIIIGWQPQNWYINKTKLYKHLLEISEQYDLLIQPDALISDLSAGEKQRVEIIKMLYRNVNILILDEPTSILTPQESKKLFKNLREMKTQGKTVIFISHKLNEIMDIADRVTVLRRGKLIKTLDKDTTNPKELTNMMIGREMQTIEKKQINTNNMEQKPILIVNNLQAKGDEGEIALKDISFSMDAGEILGVAGVSGNGQSEFAEVLTGLRPLNSGKIDFQGKDISNSKPIDFINAGISHIPEDRIGTGTIPTFNCIDNIILKSYKKPPIKKRNNTIDYKKAKEIGEKLMKEYDVRVSSPMIPVKLLSGGNMQKLILAREISYEPALIVAVHPTYGLDVSAVEMVHQYLLKEQEKGCAILLISEDLDEILELSDTIAVMYKGQLTSKKHRNKCTVEKIGEAMMGLNNVTEEVI